jgi:hypothetical protein
MAIKQVSVITYYAILLVGMTLGASSHDSLLTPLEISKFLYHSLSQSVSSIDNQYIRFLFIPWFFTNFVVAFIGIYVGYSLEHIIGKEILFNLLTISAPLMIVYAGYYTYKALTETRTAVS